MTPETRQSRVSSVMCQRQAAPTRRPAVHALVAVAVLACGASAAQDKPPGPAMPPYQLGPSDVLQIIVWKEPDLSRDVTVRFDGMITVPLIGDVQAAGRTPTQVAQTVAASLGEYLEAPRVTIGVSQANSARFYVVGQVTKSGE